MVFRITILAKGWRPPSCCGRGMKSNFNEVQILAQLKTRLANYKIPKKIVTIVSLPRNPMGKILKPELRVKYSTMFSAPSL